MPARVTRKSIIFAWNSILVFLFICKNIYLKINQYILLIIRGLHTSHRDSLAPPSAALGLPKVVRGNDPTDHSFSPGTKVVAQEGTSNLPAFYFKEISQ